MARHIGRRAEIGGMAEGQEPAGAQQQIEGAGEKCVAKHLREEQRIEEEGRADQQHGGACIKQEREGVATAGRGGHGAHRSRPRRPAGLISSTAIMITKTTMFEPWG